MHKSVCLITGATEGVGKATAVELAKKGFTIVMAARMGEADEIVKSPRRRCSWPRMTPVLSRESSFSLMVAGRRFESTDYLASIWEN